MKEDTLISQDEHVKAQPSLKALRALWCKNSIFDKNGCRVEYLNLTCKENKTSEENQVRNKIFHRKTSVIA